MSAQVGIKSDCLPTVCHQLYFSTRIGIDINYSKQCYAYAPLHTHTCRHSLKQQLCGILLLSRDKEQEGSWSGGIGAHNRLISLRAIALRTQHWHFSIGISSTAQHSSTLAAGAGKVITILIKFCLAWLMNALALSHSLSLSQCSLCAHKCTCLDFDFPRKWQQSQPKNLATTLAVLAAL